MKSDLSSFCCHTLHLSHNVQNEVGATSTQTWTNLETAFGLVGVFCIYGDFKALVGFKISGSQHPVAELQHFFTHLECLRANNVQIPDKIVRMIILSSLIARWDHIAAIYLQGKTAMQQITSAAVQQAIVAEFDWMSRGSQQHTHKISVVKRKGKHPSYQQQKGANDHPASSQGSSEQPKCSKKNWRGKQHANIADDYPFNTFTLAASVVQAQPQIAIQPSRAPPNILTIASFKPSGTTYSQVVSKGRSAFNGIPPVPGDFSIQEKCSLLKRIGEKPMGEALKKAADHLTHSQRHKMKRNAKQEASLVMRVNLPIDTDRKGKDKQIVQEGNSDFKDEVVNKDCVHLSTIDMEIDTNHGYQLDDLGPHTGAGPGG